MIYLIYQFLKIRANCISYEGFYTYGGLNGRDMEVLAIGLYEAIDEHYLEYRIGQMEYLAARLDDAGITYQSPVGGHGVFIDAAAMLPQIPWNEFPGQTLVIELYKEAGIRTCDIGSYMLGNNPDTGEQLHATFEFTRLAKRANKITSGYKITWEPPILRHFQAKLTPVKHY